MTTGRLASSRVRWLLGLALVSAACSQMLGIEDAHVDETLLDGAGGAVTGTSSGTGGSDVAGGQGGAGGAPLCERYCDAVMTACDPEDPDAARLPQYGDMAQCLAVCGRLDPGRPGDRNVNTVECRVHQAELARYEVLDACPKAGPEGRGACGGSCESYCALMMAVCTAESVTGFGGEFYFDTFDQCLEQCGDVPDGGPFWQSVDDFYLGNTLQCRLFHLSVAALDAFEHCEHAKGVSVCAAAGDTGGAAGAGN